MILHRERGFTLLEAVIALIIASLAVAALLRGAGGGLGNARVASQYQEAVSRAQSRLALLDAAPPDTTLRPGQQDGDDGGGYSWQVDVDPGDPVPRRAGADTKAARPALFRVTVAILWGAADGQRRVALSTWRLGLLPPDPP